MNKYYLKVGDEVYDETGPLSRTYIITNYKPGDNWVIVLSKADGWIYGIKSDKLVATGSKYAFSDVLMKELEHSHAYSYSIPKRLLSNEHLRLIT